MEKMVKVSVEVVVVTMFGGWWVVGGLTAVTLGTRVQDGLAVGVPDFNECPRRWGWGSSVAFSRRIQVQVVKKWSQA